MSVFAYFVIEMQVEQKTFSELVESSKLTEPSEEVVTFYKPQIPKFVPIKTVPFVNDIEVIKNDTPDVDVTPDPVLPDPKGPSRPDGITSDELPKFMDEAPVETIEPFINIEDTPIFPGCENLSKEERDECFREKVLKHIQRNLRFPESALENNQQGRVHVQFLIEKDGTISIANLRGPYESLNKEASRVIKLLPKMKPGEQRKKPVRVSYLIPIVFKSQN